MAEIGKGKRKNNRRGKRKTKNKQRNNIHYEFMSNKQKSNNNNECKMDDTMSYSKKNNNKYNNKSSNKHTKMVIFDFDETLSCEQITTQAFNDLRKAFGGRKRLNLLKRYLEYLKSNDIKLLILSFNNKETIKKVLIELKLNGYFDDIFDRETVIKYGGYYKGKGNFIQEYCNDNGMKLNNIVFIDDVKVILEYCECKTIHVNGNKGITLKDMNQILNLLGFINKPDFIK